MYLHLETNSFNVELSGYS